MFDLTPKPSAQPAGQPVEPSAPKPETAQGAQGNGLTLEQIRAEMKVALVESKREEQSQRDKLEARVKKQVQDLATMFTAANGAAPTADQMKVIEQAARQQAVEPAESPAPAPAPAQTQAAPAPGDNPLIALASEIMQEHGVTLEENDPEAKGLKLDEFKGTPRAWLKAFEAAVIAKQERTAPPIPGAVLPTSGGGSTPGNRIANIIDPNQLFKLAQAKVN